MADNKPLEVAARSQEKKELVAKGEKTVPARIASTSADRRNGEGPTPR